MTDEAKPKPKAKPKPAPKTNNSEPLTLDDLAADIEGKGLYAKIAWIQQHIGHVDKTGQVKFKGVEFAHMQEHGLLEVLRPFLRITKLAVIPGAMQPGDWKLDGNTFVVDVALTVVDTESGDKCTRWYPNLGVDSSDKAANKAYTGANKYALQKFFLIPTEKLDDNETVDTDRIPGTDVSSTVKGATTDQVDDTARATLRATLIENAEGLGGKNAIKNHLTARYGVSKMDDLDRDQFKDFSDWVTNTIAGTLP